MAAVVLYPDGEGVPLRLVGAVVADLVWTTGIGNGMAGGCQQASFRVDLDPREAPDWLDLGCPCTIFDACGHPVWAGMVTEVDPGDGYAITCRGLAARGKDFLAIDANDEPSSAPDTAVDQAILRGLPWTSPGLSPTALSTDVTKFQTVAEVLDAYAVANAQRWAVWADGGLTVDTAPTTPDYLLSRLVRIPGVADDAYFTHGYGRYVSAVDGSGNPTAYDTAAAANADAAAKVQRREAPIDLTKRGVLSSLAAAAATQTAVDSLSARMGWTNGFDISVDDLTTIDGCPARLQLVRAGEMIRVTGAADVWGRTVVGKVVDVVIGETSFDTTRGILAVNPVGLVDRDIASILSPEPPGTAA